MIDRAGDLSLLDPLERRVREVAGRAVPGAPRQTRVVADHERISRQRAQAADHRRLVTPVPVGPEDGVVPDRPEGRDHDCGDREHHPRRRPEARQQRERWHELGDVRAEQRRFPDEEREHEPGPEHEHRDDDPDARLPVIATRTRRVA